MNKETLEDLAEYYALKNYGNRNGPNFEIKIDAFKAGANWQKEQSASEAIEFVKWLDKNYKVFYAYSDYKTYVHKNNGDVPLTLEILYILWKKQK
jgi:hypothetical protein